MSPPRPVPDAIVPDERPPVSARIVDDAPYAAVMTSRVSLTDAERDYIQSQTLGRLATVDADGAPQNNPVGVFIDDESGDIIIGGGAMGTSRKFRNVQANARVALVIDDLVSRDPWTVRGLEIRGTAVALSDVDPPVSFMSREVIRITPNWIVTWGLDPDAPGRQRRTAG